MPALIETSQQPSEHQTELKPVSSPEQYDKLSELPNFVSQLKASLLLPGFKSELWQPEQHDTQANSFLLSEANLGTLFVSLVEGKLILSGITALPETYPFMYFIYLPGSPKLAFGTVSTPHTDLLSLLSSIYAPLVMRNSSIPPGVSSQLKSNMHKFLAYYLDTVNRISARQTQLYVPPENLADLEVDKELLARLEVVIQYWTWQIKSLLSIAVIEEGGRGLMGEVDFWKRRCEDLNSINVQVNCVKVQEICGLLRGARSGCVEVFDELVDQIAVNYRDAERNRSIVGILEQPCLKLRDCTASEFPAVLRKLMASIRVIWLRSSCYDTTDKLSGLVRRLSNDIIDRCMRSISLDDIFNGQNTGTEAVLVAALNSCELWKAMFSAYQAHMEELDVRWKMESISIFSQVDAFVQRCLDLREILEGQSQFSRMKGGVEQPIPLFGGTSGKKITKAFDEMDTSFATLMSQIKKSRDIILDVKRSEYHELFLGFKRGLKELEIRFQNTIALAFDEVNSLESHVAVFALFHSIAQREAIVRNVEKRAVDLGKAVLHDLMDIKSNFEQYRKTPEILRIHPDNAGSAYWSKNLLKSANRIYELFKLVESQIVEHVGNQIHALHEQTVSLEEYTQKVHQQWLMECQVSFLPLLSRPVLVRMEDEHLKVNFSRDLSKALAEGDAMTRIGLDLPPMIQEIMVKRDELYVLVQNVDFVVGEYNGIVDDLPKNLLFREKLRILDKKLNTGLTSLTWLSKGSIDFFVKEFKKISTEMRAILKSYNDCCGKVLDCCNELASTILCRIEQKRIYTLEDFESFQEAYRQTLREKLVEIFGRINSYLKGLFDLFRSEKESLQHWHLFLTKIDSVIGEALRTSVKKSLQEIAKAINGEGKNKEDSQEIYPIFRVNVVLENQKVEFNPPLQKLEEQVNKIAREMISCISVISLIADSYNDEAPKAASQNKSVVYEAIVREDDVLKIFAAIQSGMSSNTGRCQSYLHNWDAYREIWEVNKDAFIRRYAKLKPSVSTFDADISRYHEVANNVQKEETFSNVNFVRLDCSSLKQTIVGHCNSWQDKLTSLLSTNASADIKAFYNHLETRSKSLAATPTDLEMLSELASTIAAQKEEMSNIQARMDPIQEQYQILEKYDVQPREEDKALLDGLEDTYEAFLNKLSSAEKNLDQYKTRFRNDLTNSVADFAKNALAAKQEFLSQGPLRYTLDIANVLSQLSQYDARCQKLADTERNLRKGLNLFRIDQAPSRDLEWLVKTVDCLRQLWNVVQDWNVAWEEAKAMNLPNIKKEVVGETFLKFQKKLGKFSKDGKEWQVYEYVNARNEQICSLIKVVGDLQNAALRQKHWIDISTVVSNNCNPFDTEFTLEKMVEYSLDKFAAEISKITQDAVAEF